MTLLLLAQLAPPATNPEAMIAAAVAAAQAQQSAFNASMISLLVLALMLLVFITMLILVYKADHMVRNNAANTLKLELLERNTDGLLTTLMDATRKLALIEGNVAGRAEQKQEEAVREKEK